MNPQSSSRRLVGGDQGWLSDRGGESSRRECGVREVAEALGGGADVRLAGPIPEEQPGLRAVHGLERGDDQDQFDSSHAQVIETRSVQDAGALQVPGITGKNYRIACELDGMGSRPRVPGPRAPGSGAPPQPSMKELLSSPD